MTTLRFAMIVHEAEEGGYWASFPELPGCFTQADSLEDLRQNAKEAVAAHVSAMQERGDPLPESGVLVEPIEASVELAS